MLGLNAIDLACNRQNNGGEQLKCKIADSKDGKEEPAAGATSAAMHLCEATEYPGNLRYANSYGSNGRNSHQNERNLAENRRVPEKCVAPQCEEGLERKQRNAE